MKVNITSPIQVNELKNGDFKVNTGSPHYIKFTNELLNEKKNTSKISTLKALETFTTDLGINFTVYRPFMIPYLESYYFLYNTLPEWDYEELEPSDIIETLFTIQAMLGNDIDISLENWAGLWKFEDDLTTQFKD